MTHWGARASSYVDTSIYGHKKKVCLEQNISIGSIHVSFHNFHNVSMYMSNDDKNLIMVSLHVFNNTINITTLSIGNH